MKKNILVIAAHPDDEVLGCGGSIAAHSRAGDQVHVVIMAEGMTSRLPKRNRGAFAKELKSLGDAARKANKILGAFSVTLLNFPDNRMDSLDRLDITKAVEDLVKKYQPTIVYTHHVGDVNIDHRCIHDAVITACRPLPGQCVKTILFWETSSSTEYQPPNSAPPFLPNWWNDISATLDLKIEALRAYHVEMRPWPHARSLEAVEHLAKWRGASIGVPAAEAFMLGRQINRISEKI